MAFLCLLMQKATFEKLMAIRALPFFNLMYDSFEFLNQILRKRKCIVFKSQKHFFQSLDYFLFERIAYIYRPRA